MEKKIEESANYNMEKMTERITQMISNTEGPWDDGKLEALSRNIASRKWDDVIKIYESYPESREVKIDKYSGDTAIHLAVSDQQQSKVKKMVTIVGSKVLATKNNQGNTPLHLAASLGSTDICRCIAEKDKDSNLTSLKNENGETPVFLAVAKGKLDAFLYLRGYCRDKEDESAYSRRNGDTILHAAVSGQHFEIAYCIIHEYPELVHKLNEQKESPLHLLAAMPSAFKSGNPLIGLSRLIYHSIIIGKLKQNPKSTRDASPKDIDTDTDIDADHSKNSQQDEETANEGVDCSESRDQQDKAATCGEGLEDKICTAILYILIPIVLMCTTVYRVIRWVVEYILSLVMAVFKLVMCIPVDHKKNSQLDEEAVYEQVDHSKSHQEDKAAAPGQDDKAAAPGQGLGDKILTDAENLLFYTFCICLMVYWVIKWVIKHILSSVKAAFELVMFISGYKHFLGLIHLKKRCTWSVQVMNELIGVRPQSSVDENQDLGGTSRVATTKNFKQMQTALFIAAKHGVVEMVERILQDHANAILETSTEQKNIVMLAAENRHPHLYEFLLRKSTIVRTIFEKVDKDGKSVLHFAAQLNGNDQRPWRNIRGAALQMHMEVKWYSYVKENMPYNFLSQEKRGKKTPEKLFEESHEELKKEGRKWLIDNSQSCSVVAALIATVAFATSATFPGGFKQDNGIPALENDLVFIISAVASLMALCSSMISVVMFLGILTSSFQLADFLYDLPIKHLVAMVSLLVSILSMSVSFLAGHHFVLKQKLNDAALPVYIALCISLLFFIIINFPLDYPTIRTILRKKPRQCGKSVYSRISL